MIHRSPLPDVDIPNESLADFVLERAHERGDRAALIDGTTGRAITYAELPCMVDRLAVGLARLGIGKRDVCAIFSPNCVEYALAVLAVARLGAITTTINPTYTVDEVAPQLVDCAAKLIFTSPLLHDAALAAATRAGVGTIVSFGAMPDAIAFESLMTGDGDVPRVAIDPAVDLLALPYSSGTTGLPKGVMLTHRNVIANIVQLDAGDHMRDGTETLICILPFFHIYGLTVVMLSGLWRGATLVVVPRFDLAQFVDLVERHRATLLHIVPPIVLALAKHPLVEGRDFSSVRKLFSGAAPLGADLIEQCCRRIDCELQQGYGMTEASPATHSTAPTLSYGKIGTVGICVPNTECIVADLETGEPLEAWKEGELWVRGPQVMRGYLNQPEATRRTLDQDGWLHTGDIGYADSDGDFHIVDRLKELIKYKGFQIAPAELEALLLAHPCVADAAVVPMPDAIAGEVPKAFVVLRSPASSVDLAAHVAEHVAPYKRLRAIEFVDAIPKSASGKILRRVLRDAETQRARDAMTAGR